MRTITFVNEQTDRDASDHASEAKAQHTIKTQRLAVGQVRQAAMRIEYVNTPGQLIRCVWSRVRVLVRR